jgi:squalene-associated FAD-dependent desaturase
MVSKLRSPGARGHCVVIGGGLSGLSAACSLVDQGVSVTLLEKRPFLGGRAYSFTDTETGQDVDNGQHVYLGCCNAYTGFLKQLGVFERTTLQQRLRIPVVDSAGKVGIFSGAPLLPAPLHLLPSFLRFPHLGLRDKIRAASAMLSIMRTDREKHRDALEAQTFGAWLDHHGQSERSRAVLWDLITLPVLNDSVNDVSAYMGIMAFQDGLLRGRNSANIGYSHVGLTELISDAAKDYITQRGGQVLSNRTATGIIVENGHATGVDTGVEIIPTEAVVSAVPWDALPKLLPAELAADPFFTQSNGLEWAPIVGIHVWYDRPVMEEEFLATLDSPVQWVFNKSRIQGLPGPGQYLCVSISGAWEHAPMTKDALRAIFLPELERLFPKAASATVQQFIVVKQLAATFRCTPGAQVHRLPQRTPVDNFVLAGDWTQTGWPATMESAVRSGFLATAEVIRALDAGRPEPASS